ncbi:MAG: hypothetical protein QMD04_14915, partial [Anaerolineales bacterium]|nr:hypothetical protein [Anaerolineales bacterium]
MKHTQRITQCRRKPKRTEEGQKGRGNIWKEAAYGFQYIFARPSLLGLQLVFFVGNLFAGIGWTVFAPMILARTDSNSLIFGSVQTAGAIGGVIMSAYLGQYCLDKSAEGLLGRLVNQTLAEGLLGNLRAFRHMQVHEFMQEAGNSIAIWGRLGWGQECMHTSLLEHQSGGQVAPCLPDWVRMSR